MAALRDMPVYRIEGRMCMTGDGADAHVEHHNGFY